MDERAERDGLGVVLARVVIDEVDLESEEDRADQREDLGPAEAAGERVGHHENAAQGEDGADPQGRREALVEEDPADDGDGDDGEARDEGDGGGRAVARGGVPRAWAATIDSRESSVQRRASEEVACPASLRLETLDS